MKPSRSYRTEAPLQTTRAPRTRGAFVSMSGEAIAPVAIDVLLRPRTALRKIASAPAPGEWFVAASVSLALLSFVQVTRTGAAMRIFLSDGGSESARAAAELAVAREMQVRVFGAPLGLVASALPAALLLIAARGRSASLSRRACIAAAIAGETPVLLGRLVDLEVLWVDGVEMTTELSPLVHGSTSVGALVPIALARPLAAAAETLSPFTIWSAVFNGIAVRDLASKSPGAGLIAGIAALGMRLGIAALVERGLG